MTAENVTWMKFYPQDWLADPGLRMCSPAARGVWMDLIAVMHDAQPYGHLLLGDTAPSMAALGRLCGVSARTMAALLRELEENNVLARTPAGIIYSRRMVRDEAARAQGREHAAKAKTPPTPPTPPGGEATPTPPTPRGEGGGDTPHPPGGEPPRSRARKRPETRDQKEEPPSSLRSSAPHDANGRGQRLPADWQPSPDDVAFCQRLDLSPAQVADRFADYWRAKPGAAGRKADWPATWRNWCRREAEQRQQRAAPRPDSAHSLRTAAVRALAEDAGLSPSELGFLQ